MVMTRYSHKPRYELWCQHKSNIITKAFNLTAVMMALLLLPPIGVIAGSSNLPMFEPNNTSVTNHSHYHGRINELNLNAFITSDENEMINTRTSSLPSWSLTEDDGTNNNSRNVNNSENIELLSTTDNSKSDKVIETQTTIEPKIDLKSNKIQSTKPSLKDIEDVANRTHALELIESLNVRKETQSTVSIEMITTNKPYVSSFSSTTQRHKIAAHTRQYQSKHYQERHFSGPFFEGPLDTSAGALNAAVHLYTEGIFNCRVGMLKDKTVMWVRRTTDKFSLLTVGNITYSGDPRIRVTFQYPNNWRLHINPMLKDDAGLYMCQVSTHPPRVFATNVTVMQPAIRVVDEQGNEVHDRYYKIGSTIDLTCQVATTFITKNSTSTVEPGFSLLQKHINTLPTAATTLYPPPISAFSVLENDVDESERATLRTAFNDSLFQRICWTKDGENISKGALFNLSTNGGWITSRLSILSAERQHSGIYSCSIINSTSALVDVQILNGESPAAVQHSIANRVNNIYITLQALASLLIALHIS